MKIQNPLGLIGGLLLAVSVFLPAISLMGTQVSFWQVASGVAGFYIICGGLLAGLGFSKHRKLHIVGLLLSLITLLLALKYWSDAGESASYGIWLLLLGSILGLLGSVQSIWRKPQTLRA